MSQKHKPTAPTRAGGPPFAVILGIVALLAGVVLLVSVGIPSGIFSSSTSTPRNNTTTEPKSFTSSAPAPASAPATATSPAIRTTGQTAPPPPPQSHPPATVRAGKPPPPLGQAVDPLFDFAAIASEPLDAIVLKSSTVDGLITEEFEYTSFIRDGKPDRVRGILVYPQSAATQPANGKPSTTFPGAKLPGVFWSQSGMYDATPWFPTLFAKKGCFSLNITLPISRRNAFAAFDTADPKHANLTLLAIDQMRAITYMTQRPEVDPDRIIALGSSYGGFFATLLAASDPRVVGGMAFFGAGHQATGTNLPQFTALKSTADVETWNRLIDPAIRLKQRAVPFLFTCPSNDNWFFPPSVVETFRDAPGDCRLAIVPHWQHGFPESIDNQIVDFADVLLGLGRPAYNKPSALTIEPRDGKLFAQWSWTGENPVKRAELIVSYGPVHDWHYWNYRHHEILQAQVSGNTATAELPAPFRGAVAYVYGNIIDARDVLTSTIPQTIDTATLPVTSLRPDLAINTVTYGEFEKAGVDFLTRSGEQCGIADTAIKHGGEQSIRMEPLAGANAGAQSIGFRLHWIPGQPHRLSVWLRSAQAAKLEVRVEAAAHRQWSSPTVMELVRRTRPSATQPTRAQLPVHAASTSVGEEWTRVQIDVPAPAPDVEGFNLRIIGDAKARVPFWIDDLSLEPVWRSPR